MTTRDETERLERFAASVAAGAVVHCSPDIYEAIQKDSALVGSFAGVQLRSSRLVPPNTLCAVQLDKSAPPLSYDLRWVDGDVFPEPPRPTASSEGPHA